MRVSRNVRTEGSLLRRITGSRGLFAIGANDPIVRVHEKVTAADGRLAFRRFRIGIDGEGVGARVHREPVTLERRRISCKANIEHAGSVERAERAVLSMRRPVLSLGRGYSPDGLDR